MMLGARILVVEDDRLVRDLVAYTLEEHGYTVDAVATARQAWACLAGERYAFVIADWRLPDGDGTVVADRAAGDGARTLVMSAYFAEMPADRASRHRMLMKPIRPAEIVAEVERIARGIRARRANSSLLQAAEDSGDVELVARQYVQRRGAEAVEELEDLATMAAAIGDTESAAIWREIADMAHSIVVHGGYIH